MDGRERFLPRLRFWVDQDEVISARDLDQSDGVTCDGRFARVLLADIQGDAVVSGTVDQHLW